MKFTVMVRIWHATLENTEALPTETSGGRMQEKTHSQEKKWSHKLLSNENPHYPTPVLVFDCFT